jgi:hypothetical protein
MKLRKKYLHAEEIRSGLERAGKKRKLLAEL